MIKVKSLIKVFGKRPQSILPLIQKGQTRKEIFQKHNHLVALNNIDMSINQGELAVVIGLSGSGKSTLLRTLNRLIEPTSGSIFINGNDITKLSAKELRHLRQSTFGMVFQHFALLPHYTVLQNAAFGLELKGMSKKEREKTAYEALECVGLTSWAQSKPHKLSGGMQQRVGLARTLALNPSILLMDEAFSALDPLTRREMQEELLRLQSELKKTIVFISHDLDEALRLGNKIILLRDGSVVQEGTPEEFISNPADEHVANFIKYVDRGQVLTAGSIMVPPIAICIQGVDDTKSTLRKMELNSLSNLFVLNNFHSLIGIVQKEDLLQLKLEGKNNIKSIIQKDIVSINNSTPLSQIINSMANLPYPLPVLDQHNRLEGVIIRGLLLDALSSSSEQPAKEEILC